MRTSSVVAILLALALVGRADAQTYQVNSAHTGNASGAGVGAVLTPLWRADTTAQGAEYAVVAPGRVYVAGVRDGRAYALALDAATGRELWAAPLAEQWSEGPFLALAGDRLVATAGSVVAAIDVATGTVLWQGVAGGKLSPPVVADGLVIATRWQNSYGSEALAWRLADGAPAWVGERTGGRNGGATIANGTVVFMAGCGAVASRIADGVSVWAQDPLCGGIAEITSFDGERIWSGTHTRGQQFDPATGAAIARYEGADAAFDGDLAVLREGGALVARDRRTLVERWRFAPPVPLVTAPLIADGVVYAADDPGLVHSVDLATGVLLSTTATGTRTSWQGTLGPGLAAGQGLLIVPTGTGIAALRGNGVVGQPAPAKTQAPTGGSRLPQPTRVRALTTRASNALRADRRLLAKAKHRRAAAVRALRRLDALRRDAAKVDGTLELRRAMALHRRGLVHYRAGNVRAGRTLLARAAVAVRALRGATASASAAESHRVRARQTVEGYSAALRREDWGSVCRYIAPGSKQTMIERVRDQGHQVKGCASAARRWDQPRDGLRHDPQRQPRRGPDQRARQLPLPPGWSQHLLDLQAERALGARRHLPGRAQRKVLTPPVAPA